jgi:hypothetical protein
VSDLRGRWSFDDDNFSDPVSPADYTNLNLWLDASDSSTLFANTNFSTPATSSVAGWKDKSGNDYHATAPSGAEPTTGAASINGKNVLNWSVSKKMNRSTPTSANWLDVYVVAKWNGGTSFSNHNGLFGGTASGDGGLLGNSDSPGTGIASGWFDNFYLNGSVSSTSGVINSMSSAFIASISKDSAVSVTGYQVGFDRVWPNRGWDGVIAEVLAFGTKLSVSERQKIEGYLAHKWGVSVESPNTVLAAKDSSSNAHHGILKKNISPAAQPELKLWLDAADSSTITHSSNASVNGVTRVEMVTMQ